MNGHVAVPAATTDNHSLSIALDVKKLRILVTTPDYAIMGYKNTGIIDSSFGMNGKLSVDFSALTSGISDVRSEQLLLQPDLKILSAGYLNDHNGAEVALARFINAAAINAMATTISNQNIKAALYPNPVASTLNISGLDANCKYNFTIVDANGNIVAARRIDNARVYLWNVQSLNRGVYYLNIKSRNQSLAIKFIKR